MGASKKSNFNEGYICNYSYMRHKSTETINCSFKTGIVQKTHFSNMTSTITDTTSCSYLKGYCRVGNTHLLWEPIEEEKFQYIDAKNLTCSKIKNHIICDEISKSFNTEKMEYVDKTKTYKDKMWRIKIWSSESQSPKVNMIKAQDAQTDTGKQIEALRTEIQDRLQYIMDWVNSPEGKLNIICMSILQINKVTKSSLSLYPTQFAEIITRTDNLIAQATLNYLIIWPCKMINEDEFKFKKLEQCYTSTPITYKNKTAFFSKDLILNNKATKIDCEHSLTKVFELNKKLYIQRKNNIPTEITSENFNNIHFFHNFNFSNMPTLSDDWEITPEVFDNSIGLFDNIREDIEKNKKSQDKILNDHSARTKLDLFGIRNTSIFGIIDAIITWVTRSGAFVAYYLLLRK